METSRVAPGTPDKDEVVSSILLAPLTAALGRLAGRHEPSSISMPNKMIEPSATSWPTTTGAETRARVVTKYRCSKVHRWARESHRAERRVL